MTKEEIKVVTFVLTAFFLGWLAKHYRNTHPQPQELQKPAKGHVMEPKNAPNQD